MCLFGGVGCHHAPNVFEIKRMSVKKLAMLERLATLLSMIAGSSNSSWLNGQNASPPPQGKVPQHISGSKMLFVRISCSNSYKKFLS